jgi:GTP-binding protein
VVIHPLLGYNLWPMNNIFTIAIIGRPNVGKSALFNRIARERKSIVEDIEGVTRDALYSEVEVFGKKIRIVDTGGIDSKGAILFSKEIRMQTLQALDRADAVIFVVDGVIGPTMQDEEIASLLLKKSKPMVLAVNKVDDFSKSDVYQSKFYSLGVSDMVAVSAVHGIGVADLLEVAMETYFEPFEKPINNLPKVAIVGRPNVGKSTLMNAIVGEDRCVVSDVPGTTRDTIDEEINGVLFIDTAGLKKKQQEKEVVEKFARIRTEEAIDRSNICVLVIDVQDGITTFEKTILTHIEEKGKGCILFLNKWDLANNYRMEHAIAHLRLAHPVLEHVPVIVGSAKTGRNVDELFDHIFNVYENLQRRITTGELNSFLEKAIQQNHPSSISGKRLKIFYLTQVRTMPPQFVLFVNDHELFMESYRRYLLNQFRKAYDFMGCPIWFKLKSRKSKKYKTAEKSSSKEEQLQHTH